MRSATALAITIVAGLLAAPLAAQTAKPKIADGPPESYTVREVTPDERTIVAGFVMTQLRDPRSARFGTMMASVAANGATIVCGNVKLRSGPGGRGEYRAFFGMLVPQKNQLAFFPVEIGTTEDNDEIARLACAEYNLPRF